MKAITSAKHTYTQLLGWREGSRGTYGLSDWRIGIGFPSGGGNFSLHHHIQIHSAGHLVSHLRVTV